jgi:hypothetical protein
MYVNKRLFHDNCNFPTMNKILNGHEPWNSSIRSSCHHSLSAAPVKEVTLAGWFLALDIGNFYSTNTHNTIPEASRIMKYLTENIMILHRTYNFWEGPPWRFHPNMDTIRGMPWPCLQRSRSNWH